MRNALPPLFVNLLFMPISACTVVPDSTGTGAAGPTTTTAATTASSSGTTEASSTSTGGCGTQSDPNNCGECGHVCAAPFNTCTEGHCGDEIRDVVGGGDASCVVLWNGKLYCWGGNFFGQLGDGTSVGTEACKNADNSTFACRPEPAPVRAPAPSAGDLEHVVQASMSYYNVCAVTSDGEVFCWGDNNNLALGHDQSLDTSCANPPNGSVFCNLAPVKVGLPATVKAAEVSCGLRYTCIRSTDGEVYCWGANDYGQIGAPLTTTLTDKPTKVAGLQGKTVSQISVDANDFPMACALASGRVWCWGSSNAGGLGHDPARDPACGANTCSFTATAVATETGILDQVEQIGVGRSWGCALRMDHTVWCWGSDSWGVLGNGTAGTPRHFAAPVNALPPQVTSLFTDRASDVFVTDANGTLFGWGRNNYGSLGTGTLNDGPGCSGGCEWLPRATGLESVRKLSSAANSALALLQNGSLVIWGDNGFAELGHLPGTGMDELALGGWVNPTPTALKVP